MVTGYLDSSGLVVLQLRPKILQSCAPTQIDRAAAGVLEEVLLNQDVLSATLCLNPGSLRKPFLADNLAFFDDTVVASNHVDC